MLEGENDYLQGSIADEMVQHSYTTSTTTAGTESNFITQSISWVDKYLLFNYSIFYDVDSITGAQTPNDFAVIRYFCIICLIGLLLSIFFLMRAAAISV
jgi:hypothetical protein